jgi:hypothetical protein
MKLRFIHPNHYYQEFLKLIHYILNPVYIASNNNTTLYKVKGTWSVFIIKTVLTIISGALVTLIIDPVNQTTIRWTEIYSTGTIFLLSIIILPVLEEISFRMSLRFKPVYLALTLGVLTYYGVTKIGYQTNLTNIEHHFNVRVLISVITTLTSYSLISQPQIKNHLDTFWKVHFKWVFYFFCITFAWMHILNYELNVKHVLLLPLITLPKLVSAISYGYIRMHYGFIYSLGLPMCWNSMGFIMSLFSSLGGD